MDWHVLRAYSPLIEHNVYHYDCNEILSVMIDDKANIEEAFVFDCIENSVSSDILFPPEINPMTGEWTQNIPDVFVRYPKTCKGGKNEVVKINNSVNSPKITENQLKLKKLLSGSIMKKTIRFTRNR